MKELSKNMKMLLVIGIILTIVVSISSYLVIQKMIKEQREIEAKKLFDEGMVYYNSKEYGEAISKWKIVYDNYKGTSVWGIATYNIGISYMNLEEYNSAIPYFEDILRSNVNDYEKGESVMEPYRNYRYNSCLRISESYEYLGDYNKALEYIILAKDKYKYRTWCGTCAKISERSLNKRINRLILFKEWNVNKTEICSFYMQITLNTTLSNEYNVSLPIPIVEDETNSEITYPSIITNNITVIDGNPDFEIVNTNYGYALNISAIGSCSIKMSYTILNNSSNYNTTIFSNLSLKDKQYQSSHWLYYYSKNNLEIRLSINGSWIKYPPKWEYQEWKVSGFLMERGWNREYIFGY